MFGGLWDGNDMFGCFGCLVELYVDGNVVCIYLSVLGSGKKSSNAFSWPRLVAQE